MRIILTGATGFVGGETLTQLLLNERVEAVTCIGRRPVAFDHPKLTTIVHEDFTVWPTTLMRDLAVHDAAIWTLGAKASDMSDPVEYERVTVKSTLSFASSMCDSLDHAFRFCYLSGMGADPAEKTVLPWQKTTRHMKGRAERGLENLAKTAGNFRASSFRPGGILPNATSGWLNTILSPIAIRVDMLCSAMITEALSEGLPTYRMLSNHAIRAVAERSSS
jgi:nucleoside-diphosphate-sugar epimerase